MPRPRLTAHHARVLVDARYASRGEVSCERLGVRRNIGSSETASTCQQPRDQGDREQFVLRDHRPDEHAATRETLQGETRWRSGTYRHDPAATGLVDRTDQLRSWCPERVLVELAERIEVNPGRGAQRRVHWLHRKRNPREVTLTLKNRPAFNETEAPVGAEPGLRRYEVQRSRTGILEHHVHQPRSDTLPLSIVAYEDETDRTDACTPGPPHSRAEQLTSAVACRPAAAQADVKLPVLEPV